MAELKPRGDQKRDKNNIEFDNFQRLLKGVLCVPKEELDKRRDEYEPEKRERRAG